MQCEWLLCLLLGLSFSGETRLRCATVLTHEAVREEKGTEGRRRVCPPQPRSNRSPQPDDRPRASLLDLSRQRAERLNYQVAVHLVPVLRRHKPDNDQVVRSVSVDPVPLAPDGGTEQVEVSGVTR